MIVIFDENMSMKCYFRYLSIRLFLNRRNVCKTGKVLVYVVGFCFFISWFKFIGILFLIAVYKLS